MIMDSKYYLIFLGVLVISLAYYHYVYILKKEISKCDRHRQGIWEALNDISGLIRAKKYDEAITRLKDISTQFKPVDFPDGYFHLKCYLSACYCYKVAEEGCKEFLNEAVDNSAKALDLPVGKGYPETYAWTLTTYGLSLTHLAGQQDKQTNLERAIDSFVQALDFYSTDKNPLMRAWVQNCLAKEYFDLSEIKDEKVNLEKSMNFCIEVLEIYSSDNFPDENGKLNYHLGRIYRKLSRYCDKEEYLENAIGAFEESLRAHDRTEYPVEYTSIQRELGDVYHLLSEIKDKRENVRKSIKAYEEALNVSGENLDPGLRKRIMDNITGLKREMRGREQ